MKKKLGAEKRARQEDTDREEGGEGGGLEVRGAVRWRGRESSFSNCQSINHEKEPQGQTRQNTDPTNEILNTRRDQTFAWSKYTSTLKWPAVMQREQLSGRQHPKFKLEPRQRS